METDLNYYIVYWRAPRPEREEGTSLVYARSKRAAHEIVRSAYAPPLVDAMVPGYADLLTPALRRDLEISDCHLAEARANGHVILEHGT